MLTIIKVQALPQKELSSKKMSLLQPCCLIITASLKEGRAKLGHVAEDTDRVRRGRRSRNRRRGDDSS